MRMSFAQVNLRQHWLDSHVVLDRRLTHPRLRRIDTISARNHVHHLRLLSPTEVDAEFSAWLREAYAIVIKSISSQAVTGRFIKFASVDQ